MIVNPFWFGVLITLIVEIVLVFVGAYFVHRDRENESDEIQNRLNAALLKVIERDLKDREEAEEAEDDEDY